MSKNIQFMARIEGVWVGEGVGIYPPRVGEFHYIEELAFTPTAKPIVWEVRSATRHRDNGKPMHSEVGYLRAPPSDAGDLIEIALAHPFGVTELSLGTVVNDHKMQIMAEPSSLQRTPSAKSPPTTGLRRTYELSPDGSVLTFSMDMATESHPELQHHLLCTLRRKGDPKV